MWSFEKQILWADSTQFTSDKRLKRFNNNSIAIHHVQYNDTGRYTCKIEEPNNLEIVHKVSVVGESNSNVIKMGRVLKNLKNKFLFFKYYE